jgi:hypothetical protein
MMVVGPCVTHGSPGPGALTYAPVRETLPRSENRPDKSFKSKYSKLEAFRLSRRTSDHRAAFLCSRRRDAVHTARSLRRYPCKVATAGGHAPKRRRRPIGSGRRVPDSRAARPHLRACGRCGSRLRWRSNPATTKHAGNTIVRSELERTARTMRLMARAQGNCAGPTSGDGHVTPDSQDPQRGHPRTHDVCGRRLARHLRPSPLLRQLRLQRRRTHHRYLPRAAPDNAQSVRILTQPVIPGRAKREPGIQR